MRPGGCDQVDAVATDALVDAHGLHRCLHRQHLGRLGDLVEGDLLTLARHATLQHVVLLVGGGVTEADPGQEPVELGLRQGVGAFVLDRVGRREHAERLGQHERLALHRDLALLHRLQQRRLRLGRRAVDLVGQQQAGEDRAAPELELAVLLLVDERPGQVRGQQVRGELRPREVEPERLGERPRRQGLPEPGIVLDEHMTLGQDGGQHERERLGLAHHRTLHLAEHPLRQPGGLPHAHRRHSRSILPIQASISYPAQPDGRVDHDVARFAEPHQAVAQGRVAVASGEVALQHPHVVRRALVVAAPVVTVGMVAVPLRRGVDGAVD